MSNRHERNQMREATATIDGLAQDLAEARGIIADLCDVVVTLADQSRWFDTTQGEMYDSILEMKWRAEALRDNVKEIGQ